MLTFHLTCRRCGCYWYAAQGLGWGMLTLYIFFFQIKRNAVQALAVIMDYTSAVGHVKVSCNLHALWMLRNAWCTTKLLKLTGTQCLDQARDQLKNFAPKELGSRDLTSQSGTLGSLAKKASCSNRRQKIHLFLKSAVFSRVVEPMGFARGMFKVMVNMGRSK